MPLAVEVLVAFREQQVIGACLKHFHDVVAKHQVVDEVVLRSAPVRFADEFLQGKGGVSGIAGEGVIDTQ